MTKPMQLGMSRQLRCEDYTVGWICALPVELAAAQEMLDEEHDDLERNLGDNDENLYALGSIGGHNVAIVCLPAGRIGNNPAAAVAAQMKATFKGIRFGLMVGIGGGVPSAEADIWLGDVVVSQPHQTFGGVVQYDAGKATPSGFERTGSLNSPPQILLGAVTRVRANELRGKSNLSTHISKLDRIPQFRRNKTGPDVLFEATYDHEGGQTCERCSADRKEARQPRESEKEVVVHCGTIASGNQVMRNAAERDKVSAQLGGVLCFEMEAAGLMNSFPCLVIRGVCDYADSHKNKRWQPYAAATAAAYAKEVLSVIPPNKVEAEKKIGEVLSGLQEVAEAHRGIAQKQLEIQQDAVKQKLSHKQKECLQLFHRLQDTCMWFLRHDYFQKWLKQESGPLLVSADPGCGKSVLAKHLIDCALPRSATICYFFFKDQDQNTARQALCALLHQLFSQKPSLIQHAMKQFEKDGPALINSTNSLWIILGNAIQDPQAGSVIMVLDALDECAESEFEDLMRNSDHGKLKYLLTSRPYEQIMSKFRGLLDAFPRIRIPGEEESEVISQEVNRVIQHRKALSDKVKGHLADQLLTITHRTYLWAKDFKKTPKGSINQAYERILNKSKEHLMVRKALEMNVASVHDIDLEEEEDFKLRLRSWCGLFVSVYYGKIYFLHQTAREFLLANLPSSTTVPTEIQWHRSITIHHAHAVLAELCMRYLDFFNSDAKANHHVDSHTFLDYSAKFWGLHFREACISNDDVAIARLALRIFGPDSKVYAVWYQIYKETEYTAPLMFPTDLILASYFGLGAGHEAVVKLLLEKGADLELKDKKYGQTPLSWAVEKGHEAVVKLLLEKGADLESKDKDDWTPLSRAAKGGHEAVVKLLLEKGADLESKDKDGQTPLGWAAEKGHEAGADLELKDTGDRTPLSWAAGNGHEAVVKLLLEKGADLESKDKDDWTPLSWAAENEHEVVVKILHEKLTKKSERV
ncbi:hypothetical protein GQ44DRAFT_750330 [Phaeosphaeriaceae sp. PMI808]|nr:hypothetical protein GQ44DRAFT_750330 [Phaeosphaeriaceae sp. PMI808]